MSLDQWTTLRKTARLAKATVEFNYDSGKNSATVFFRAETGSGQMPRHQLEALLDEFDKESSTAVGKARARTGGKLQQHQHVTVAVSGRYFVLLTTYYINGIVKPLDEVEYALEQDSFRGWSSTFFYG